MSSKQVLSRREFLKITGLATGGAALAAGTFSQLFALSDKTLEVLRQGPGKVTWRNTVCRLCPGGCSLRIRRIDGVPVSLTGNPLSPINRGGTCPAAYANLEILFHPDRLTVPMARPEGPIRKELNPVSWEEILTSITRDIIALQERNQPHSIAIINGDDTPLMQELWQNVANWLGTPNFYNEEHRGENPNSTFMTQGFAEAPKLDIINADYILSLGADFLEEGAPVHFNQVLSQFKDLQNVTRNKLIYVGPRANITATSSHRWVPINPDTWGTFALGIAHILIDENTLDLDYFRKNSHGFTTWTDSKGQEHLGFENIVRSEFHPKRVEEITGVAEKDLREIAEGLKSRARPVVLCGQEALQSPRGLLHLWATHCLNFLIGAIQREGGWYFTGTAHQKVLYSLPYQGQAVQNLFHTDKHPPLEKPSLDIFAERVEGYAPYPIELLIINKANPVFHGENRTKWKTLLKHIPRVVYIGDLPNETSAHADVILPCHSAFESWDLVEHIPGVPAAAAVLQRPVIKPMYETRSSYDILKTILSGIEGFDENILPAKDAKSLVKKRLQKIYRPRQGQVFEEQDRETWKEVYQSHRRLKLELTEKQFLKALLKNGGWWDPAAVVKKSLPGVIKTKHGWFEFLDPLLMTQDDVTGDYNQLLKRLLAERKYPKSMERYTAAEELGYPLTLISGFPITNPGGKTVYAPTLMETMGILREIFWESWAEIHPETAHKYGVADGQIIQLDSPVGVIKVRARVRPIVHPDAVFIPMGVGRENVGRFSSGMGSDPRELMVPQPEINTGNTVLSGTPVRITLL
jgi:anaerobic selenocysteine-containing dehydrogenase